MDTTTAKSGILTQRYTQMQEWLRAHCAGADYAIAPLAGDASFRRYFRVNVAGQRFVLMDAPPERESCAAFVAIARAFKAYGIGVPDVHVQDLQQGFLLLSDLGDRLYLPELNPNSVDTLYSRALTTLQRIQACDVSAHYALPHYDADLLQAEMRLFTDWYLAQYRQYELNTREVAKLAEIFSCLVDNALQQPQGCVHRDYHSRNLLICDDQVGVLDFQDAVRGPVTYDLVSLIKDCYIVWPAEEVERWLLYYYELLCDQRQLKDVSLAQFTRWFDLMGLQRHLKCLGIFSRLNFRDHKPGYLAHLPDVTAYVAKVCARYPEFSPLLSLL